MFNTRGLGFDETLYAMLPMASRPRVPELILRSFVLREGEIQNVA